MRTVRGVTIMMKRILQKEFVPLMLLLLLMGCITWGARFIGVRGAYQESFVAPVNAKPSAAAAPIVASRPNLAIRFIGHRGVRMQAPENMLPTIRKAIELGAAALQADRPDIVFKLLKKMRSQPEAKD
jgi:hypothetical protein